MLSKLTRFILFNIILIFSFLTLILFYGRFIVINESFYTYSLNKNDTYQELTRSIKLTSQEFILNQFAKTTDYEKLTTIEKQEVKNQITDITSFINEDNVKDLLSKNINNILGYLHNRPGDLYLYLPINNWGFSSEVLNQIPDFLQGDNISVRELLKSQALDTPNNLKALSYLKYSSYYLLTAILASVAAETILISLYAITSKKGVRYQAVGKLKTFLGVITLITSWILNSFQNVAIQRIILYDGGNGNPTFILLPLFIKPLICIFTAYGLLELISGIILFNKKEKQLVSKANFR